jgi:N-acetylglucosaminyldiphosphoundecaprenol N-acetyl-beta-D-mannosaminyltransferase
MNRLTRAEPRAEQPFPDDTAIQTHTRVNVAGIQIDSLSEQETIARIERLIAAPGSHYMVVINAAKAAAAHRDPKLRSIISNADVVTADGMSVLWASRLLGRRLQERVTGIDLFEKLAARAAEQGLSVYLLGARDESVSAVARLLAARHPKLRVAGFHHGFFEPSQSRRVATEIRRCGADLLFVGMGSPAQEYWIEDYLDTSGARFALGVGGSFDHVSGLSKRAPVWMQRAGLEWLYRLSREPSRLWRRYLLGNSVFIWLVLRQKLKGRI